MDLLIIPLWGLTPIACVAGCPGLFEWGLGIHQQIQKLDACHFQAIDDLARLALQYRVGQ